MTRPGKVFCVCVLIAACAPRGGDAPIWGNTMGTQYGVQFGAAIDEQVRARLDDVIVSDLARVDALMSSWRDDSEISRFNAYHGRDWFAVAPETAEVVATALGVSRLSAGAFDITAAPLVELWGFGADLPGVARPSADAIMTVLQRVGWQALEVRTEPPALRKSDPQLTIDLSAIAKGYALDLLVARLHAAGVNDFLVEIGGELCTRGLNRAGQPWTIAIETPGAGSEPPTLLRPGHHCVATSGDYRNFFELDGERYSHLIDPRLGWPVRHGLASVTVVADDAMTADAWATSLLVLGPDAGLELAETQSAAVWFIKASGAEPLQFGSEAFEAFRHDP